MALNAFFLWIGRKFMTPSNFVSVIIPVYNDSERLKQCLNALQEQNYPTNMYEVIVVDNASTEDIKGIVSEFTQASYTFEDKKGSYAARNKGLTIAKGDLLAFTDSDCIPSPNWLKYGIDTLLNTDNCGLVGGDINVFFKNKNKPTSVELYESVTAFPQEEYVKESHFAATANAFTYKSVLDDIGNFNCELQSGGDVDFGKRIFAAGYHLVFSKDAYIEHPCRHSLKEIFSKHIRTAQGQFDRASQTKPPSFGNKLMRLKPPIKPAIRFLTHKDLPNLVSRLKAAYVFTLLVYLRRWVQTRNESARTNPN